MALGFILASAVLPSAQPLPINAKANFGGKPHAFTAFGAAGDGITDDTDALQKALAGSDSKCFDGESRTYRVTGTLRVSKNVCILHANFLQIPPHFDTRPFIRGKCPPITNPGPRTDCGDLPVSGKFLSTLVRYTHLRTLMIAPDSPHAPLVVYLRDVKIDKGDDPRSGSRTDAAGLWIEGARKVHLEDVEITGDGKGFGLLIANSTDVSIKKLDVHDLVWAPYAGDTPFSFASVRAQGWNSVTVREAEWESRSPQPTVRWKGVRVQEQLACVMIVRSSNVVLRDTRITNCLARFDEGDFPWQGDGLNIGGDTRDVRIEGDTRISNTWEGIDIVGTGNGIDGLSISGVMISNSFAFGAKWGYRVVGGSLTDTTIAGAGLAGFIMSGDILKARVSGLSISGVGSVNFAGRSSIVWPGEKAGVLISRGAGASPSYPREVTLSDIAVTDSAACDVGLTNRSGAKITLQRTRVTGCRRSVPEGF